MLSLSWDYPSSVLLENDNFGFLFLSLILRHPEAAFVYFIPFGLIFFSF